MTEENIVEWLKMKNAIRTYSHDDIGSARLLSDIFNKICRYNATASEWYEFNGKYWAIDLGGLKVRNMAKILAKALIKYAVSASEDDNKYLKYAATWNEHRKRNTIIQDALRMCGMNRASHVNGGKNLLMKSWRAVKRKSAICKSYLAFVLQVTQGLKKCGSYLVLQQEMAKAQ